MHEKFEFWAHAVWLVHAYYYCSEFFLVLYPYLIKMLCDAFPAFGTVSISEYHELYALFYMGQSAMTCGMLFRGQLTHCVVVENQQHNKTVSCFWKICTRFSGLFHSVFLSKLQLSVIQVRTLSINNWRELHINTVKNIYFSSIQFFLCSRLILSDFKVRPSFTIIFSLVFSELW